MRTSPRRAAAVAAAVAAPVAVLALAGCGAAHPRTHASLQLAATEAAVASGTVTATGSGSASGTPDLMTVGIGVSTTAPHAAAALAQNNSIAAAVQAALEKDGVAGSDLSTSGLSLQQSWGPSGPAGYQVSDEITVTIHDLTHAGTLIDDGLAPAGDSGRLDRVEVSFSDDDPLMAAARKDAVQSAETRAAQMAAASGGRLGSLKSLIDSPSGPSAYPTMYAASGQATAGPAVPVQPGTQKVSVQVTGVWNIVPGS